MHKNDRSCQLLKRKLKQSTESMGTGEGVSRQGAQGILYSSKNLNAVTEQVIWSPTQNDSTPLHGELLSLCSVSFVKHPKLSLCLNQTQWCSLIFWFYIFLYRCLFLECLPLFLEDPNQHSSTCSFPDHWACRFWNSLSSWLLWPIITPLVFLPPRQAHFSSLSPAPSLPMA